MSLHPTPPDPVTRSTRPWGRFDLFVTNKPCTVKIITVRPGHRLSLQRHRHRDETWQVVDGRLDVVHGTNTWTAEPGDRVWIPRGTTHRMGNSGQTATRVLEIASGDFDEDDIERLEDDYNRR
jgi:mannose-6-phosphate isomerase